MWHVLSLGVGIATFTWLIAALRRVGDRGLSMLCLAIALRHFSSAFHDYTFVPLAAGLSINAMLSLATIPVLALFIDMRAFALKAILPFYALVAFIIFSGVLNGAPADTVDAAAKWGFFIVIALSTRGAIARLGSGVVFRTVSLAMMMPVILQYASVVLGHARSGEADGSVSYIGGYYHEAVFSVILLTFLFTSMNARPRFGRVAHGVSVLAGALGVFLANYRTTLLAAAPMMAAFMLTMTLARVRDRSRPIALYALAFLAIAATPFLPGSLSARFADLGRLAEHSDVLTQPPSYFSEEDKDLLSSRVYIWSGYLHGYAQGDIVQRTFGRGPNAWEGVFDKYAHNTFISYLYEYGIVGVLTLAAAFWQTLLAAAKRVRSSETKFLLVPIVSFFILNLATMPLWQIEGMILFGLICGAIWAPQKEWTIDAPQKFR